MNLYKKNSALIVIVIVMTASLVMMQSQIAYSGDLNPPPTAVGGDGKPVETMKTLEQVKPATPIGTLPFEITAPGGYYLTSNLTGALDTNGITISTSNVRIDLKGFTLKGSSTGATGDGIIVNGNQTNLFIYNGNIIDWKADGLDAASSSYSSFKNLRFRENRTAGLIAGSHSIVNQCVAMYSGYNLPDGSSTPTMEFNATGLEAGSGSTIKNSTAYYNAGVGIKVSDGASILDCTAYNNDQNGFELSNGSTINRSVASDNGNSTLPSSYGGFKLTQESSAIECSAYDNFGNGFEYDSACTIRMCIASLNNGNGIYGGASGFLTGNKTHENDLAGIHIDGTGSQVEQNQSTDNDTVGIKVGGAGNIVIRNATAGNLTNYEIAGANSYGPIIDITGMGDISTAGITHSDHPMANVQF